MKEQLLISAFGLTIFYALLGPASCVPCTVNTDCVNSTYCTGDNSIPICQHPPGAEIVAGGGLCTCTTPDNSGACDSRDDCYTATNLPCGNETRHCYDNDCICDRFPIGRR